MTTLCLGRWIALGCGCLSAQSFSWTTQFGTPSTDDAVAVAADAGGVWVAGNTSGALPGQTSAGSQDVYLARYDGAGALQWVRQFGTAALDQAWSVAADATGVYVAGSTRGAFPGQAGAGALDAFVRKYDLGGNELWTRQFGTSDTDQAVGIAVDSSGVYVTGSTGGVLPGQTGSGAQDVFVRKYDAAGAELWTRQFGTASADEAGGIAAGVAGVYVTGTVTGDLPGQTSAGEQDAFLRAFDASGVELWTRQFGSPTTDLGRAVAMDSTGVYVSGVTLAELPGQTSAGLTDVFLRKYDLGGTELWTRQFGSTSFDDGLAVTACASGVLVAGYTMGALPGQTPSGMADAFVRSYDPAGAELWTRQFGASATDSAWTVSAGPSGAYVAGFTFGVLPGQTGAGFQDAFLARLNDPAPAAIQVAIDIKPGEFPNTINPRSRGSVSVAIFGAPALDVGSIDPATVSLAGAPVLIKGQRGYQVSIGDLNGEGLADLLVHISTEAMQIGSADTEAVLEGRTYDGKQIVGRDSIRLVPN